jgi:hypothetical protein
MEITNRRAHPARRLEDRCGRMEPEPAGEAQAFDHIAAKIDRRAAERRRRVYRRRYDGTRPPSPEISAFACRRLGRRCI